MLIVDYKSDRLDGAEPEAVVEAGYATQRIVYALAALREGAPAVEVAYCFLERPEVAVGARFEPRDIPALAERLTRLAEGVLEGRHPVAAEPHRGLCGDCPGRDEAVLVAGGDDPARAPGYRRPPGPSPAAAARRRSAGARAHAAGR